MAILHARYTNNSNVQQKFYKLHQNVQHLFPIFTGMSVKEFLKTDARVNLSEIARQMWPNNKSAKTYLSRKLSGDRPFTEKDAQLAKQVLSELGYSLISLTVGQ